MKPLDVLTALDAAGKPQEWGHKAHARSKGDAPCSIFDPSRGVCDCGLDVIRPALKAHLAAVARLVEAARDAFTYLYPGGSSPHSLSESCGCPRCDAGRYLKIALQEVDRDE